MRSRTAPPHGPTRQRGYALMLMLVLLTLGLLYGVVSRLSAVQDAKSIRLQATSNALMQAKEALIGYAATYRDTHVTPTHQVFGYLPCPDTSGDGVVALSCGSGDETVAGLLPFKTLELPELRDSSGVCLWYIVSGSFKYNPKSSNQLMNWDTQGQISIVDADGNTLFAPDDANGGAAAVIIAAGPPLDGQSRTPDTDASHPCGAMPSEVSAYLDGNYTLPNSGTLQIQQGRIGDSGNNDLIVAISPKEIFSRIVTRSDFKNPFTGSPPGQINTLSDQIRAVLEKRIQDDLVAGSTPSTGTQPIHQSGYSQFSGKRIGDLPTDISPYDPNYSTYFSEWYDQYRYAVCTSLNAATPCLGVTGKNCRGVLMFSGQATSGGPRPSTQKPPATLPAPPNAYLANYFESGSGRDVLDSATMSFSGNTGYSDSDRTADVGTCLFPGSFGSFAQDIGNFNAKTSSSTRPEATVNTGSGTVTLGNTSAGSSGSGCVWDATPRPFSTLLRAYFNFKIISAGEGFVFAIADAAQNSDIVNSCGGTSSRLGYAGQNGGTQIFPPKIGVEFDTHYDSFRGDPQISGVQENVHIAFIYWGDSGNGDDNTHGVPNPGSSSYPQNPSDTTASPPGIRVPNTSYSPLPYDGSLVPGSGVNALPLNTTIHVRVDMAKTYSAGAQPGTYTLKAYVANDSYLSSHCGGNGVSDFQNLAAPLGSLCASDFPTATIEQDNVSIADVSAGMEALQNIYAGFTNAQRVGFGTTITQDIQISDFLIRTE